MPTKVELQKSILQKERVLTEEKIALDNAKNLKAKNTTFAASATKLSTDAAINNNLRLAFAKKVDTALKENKTIDVQIKLREDNIRKLSDELTKLNKDLVGIIDKIEDPYFAVAKKVNTLNDKVPILLFPVRLETRFHQSQNVYQLWVRVYPDDCQSELDRNYLSAEECNSITAYIKDNIDLFAQKHGNNRAAFIQSVLKKNGTSADFKLAVQNQDASKLKSQFAIELNNGTAIPYASTLPNNFIFKLYNNAGVEYKTIVSKTIPAKVAMGFNEVKDSEKGIEWTYNFDKAVEIGLGVKIDITADDYNNGFNKLIVYGMRSSETATAGKVKLENLFENHYYSNGGLGIIKQGTPTNNSDNENSGYSWKDNWTDAPPADTNTTHTIASNTINSSSNFNDGEWLSQYLGIDDSLFQKVVNGKGSDQKEARLMNRALFPATMGYFFDEMMDPLVSKTNINLLESFFTNYVLGRGTIPTIRIGNQPYGILPASVWPKLKTNATDKSINEVTERLKDLYLYWKAAISQLQGINSNSPLSTADFLNIVALHPTSISFYQRIFEDISAKTNALSAANITLLPNISDAFIEELIAQSPEIRAILSAAGLNPDIDRPEIIIKLFKETDSLLNGPLIEESKDEYGVKTTEVFSETETLSKNYLSWLASSDYDTVNSEKGYDAGKKSILYMLLRHAYLLKYNDCVTSLSAKALNLSYESAKAITKDNQIINSTDKSKTAILYKPNKAITGSGTQSLKEYIDLNIASPAIKQELQPLKSYKSLLSSLSSLSKASLERAFVEHIDTCSYRIDSWINGLYSYQLRKQRENGNTWSKGIYLGSYGYLESIKKSPDRQSKGYILAPSLTHASTAALLKNAQISYSDSIENPYNINLSSERVSLAKEVLAGIKNGLSMSELLGYRFERKLHDNGLDKYISNFRQSYPMVVTANSPANSDSGKYVNKINITDGLKLMNDFVKKGEAIYSFATATEKTKLTIVLDYLQNILDAVKDVALAEGVYQSIYSNYERGNSMLNSLSKGKYPLDPEVLKTPRTGKLLTHKVALHFKPSSTKYPNSVRASLDPSVNDWLKSMLPTADKITCFVKTDINPAGSTYKLTELGIEPLDLLYLLQMDDSKANSALDDLIVGFVLQQKPTTGSISIEYMSKQDPTTFTLFELGSMIRNYRNLILQSKYLSANDFLYKSDSTSKYPNTVAKEHLEQIKNSLTILNAIPAKLKIDSTNINTTISSIADINRVLVNIPGASASFGSILEGLLSARKGNMTTIDADVLKLANDAIALVDTVKTTLAGINTALTRMQTTYAIGSPFEAFHTALKEVLGEDVIMLPLFEITENLSEVNNAYANSDSLLDYARKQLKYAFPVEEWLGGLARVREKMRTLENAAFMSQTALLKDFAYKPMQFPHTSGDRWLAIQFAQKGDGYLAAEKTLYTAVDANNNLINMSDKLCGVMIDEWTEEIPNVEETAAIAFHYNTPNAEAPQSMLLVTPPEIKGNWSLDDILDTIISTMELAKVRAVEPDHISKTPLGQFLPMTVFYAAAYNTSVVTNLIHNVDLK